MKDYEKIGRSSNSGETIWPKLVNWWLLWAWTTSKGASHSCGGRSMGIRHIPSLLLTQFSVKQWIYILLYQIGGNRLSSSCVDVHQFHTFMTSDGWPIPLMKNDLHYRNNCGFWIKLTECYILSIEGTTEFTYSFKYMCMIDRAISS